MQPSLGRCREPSRRHVKRAFGCSLGSARDGLEHALGNVEVRVHVLHVVVVLELVDQTHHLPRLRLVLDRHRRLRHELELRRFDGHTGRLDRLAHRRQLLRRRGHLKHVPVPRDVLGTAVGGDQQTYTEGYGVDFDVYIGADKKEPLHVDLVVGVIITDEVTVTPPANRLDLPRLPSNDYRLYPIADQIADKVCATMADYSGRPSSREKDLVDLVVIAKTQTVSADSLRRAIDAEARARSLIPFTELTIPPTWGRLYAKEAKEVPYCADYRSADLAGELMRAFIDPVLRGEVPGKTWPPDSLAWR